MQREHQGKGNYTLLKNGGDQTEQPTEAGTQAKQTVCILWVRAMEK